MSALPSKADMADATATSAKCEQETLAISADRNRCYARIRFPSSAEGEPYGTRNKLRQERRCSCRLSCIWRGSAQLSSRSVFCLQHRGVVGVSRLCSLDAPFWELRAGGDV